jgi:FtsH-binding integral membrane protein
MVLSRTPRTAVVSYAKVSSENRRTSMRKLLALALLALALTGGVAVVASFSATPAVAGCGDWSGGGYGC